MHRVAYRLNEKRQIELWLWPGLDTPSGVLPTRYPVLSGVDIMELQYLDASLQWVNQWPASPPASVAGNDDPVLPRAVRMRLVLLSGEEIVRIFALSA